MGMGKMIVEFFSVEILYQGLQISKLECHRVSGKNIGCL